jgi:hypothetical protein
MKWIKQPYAGDEWGKLGYVELDNGDRVSVEDESDTQVPGTSRGNNPMTVNWKLVRTLLLADNQFMEFAYGCPDCWYAADNPRSIFPHRNAHVTPEERALRAASKVAANARRTARSNKRPASAAPKALKPAQEKPRSAVQEPSVLLQDVVPAINGHAISDALTALRVVLAQAERAETAEAKLAEATKRAETAEAKLAEAKKLFG